MSHTDKSWTLITTFIARLLLTQVVGVKSKAQDVLGQSDSPMWARPAQPLRFELLPEGASMFSRMQLYVSAAVITLVEVIAILVRAAAH
jgi:hypothetical protein